MGKLGIGLGQRHPPKPQSTQQRKPMWLVECNCPTCRSWQSNKAVTPVLRRTWWKTNEGQGNDPQRNLKGNYIGQNCGKEKKIYLVAQQRIERQNVPIRVKHQIEPMEWHQSDAVPIEPNTMKKKAPPD